jgi:hypothetical protein
LLSRREKTAFLGTYVVKVPGEETNREPIRIEFPDPDHYIIRFVEGARKGDVLSSFKRESVVDVPTAEVPANYEHLKVLEPFFGPWVFEGPLQENISGFAEKGVRVRASIAYRWAVDKSAIVEDWSAHIEGKSPLKGVVLIGWDSKEKAIVDRSFTSDGGTWCSVWTVDGTTLTIKGCGIEADGTETSSVVFNKLTERGTMIWQAVEQIRAGEKLPDTAEYEYKPASR